MKNLWQRTDLIDAQAVASQLYRILLVMEARGLDPAAGEFLEMIREKDYIPDWLRGVTVDHNPFGVFFMEDQTEPAE